MKYFMLSGIHTRAWIVSEEVRRLMAQEISKRYRETIGIVSFYCRFFATVDSKGIITHLKPPFKIVEHHEIVNIPALPECACFEAFDPEVRGPWRLRGTSEHHPYCQFTRTAKAVYSEVAARQEAGIRADPLQVKDELLERTRIRSK